MKRHAFNAILALAVSLAGAPFASRAGAIQGTVRDAVTLAALRGIWVNVFQGPNPDHAGDEDWEWVGASETDTDGHYEIAGLPARHYNVQANDGRAGSGHPYIGDGLYNVSVAEGATTTVDFALRRAGMLYGFVRDAETDAAVPGVQILVEMPFVEDGAGWHTALTDANGFYEVFLAPTMDALYPVRVANAPKPGTDQSYAAQIAPGLYAASEATTRGPDFALVTGGTLRGRLTTADGTPVPGISAGDALVWTPGGLIDAMATPTDADGVFRIDGLPAGVDVWFETNDSILAEANGKTYAHGERLVGPFRVAAGDVQDMPSLYLPEAGSARLTVRDADGDPVEGARVRLSGFDRLGGWVDRYEDEVATDAAGQASYAGLPPGRYQAAAIGEGGVPVVSEEFVVASGIEAQPAVAMPTVGGTGTLTGNLANFAAVAPKNAEGAILPYTIGDYDGRHLAFGLSVLCYPTDTPWTDGRLLWPDACIANDETVADGYTDYFQPGEAAAGTFRLERVPSGDVTVSAIRETYADGLWSGVLSDPVTRTLAAGQTLGGLSLAIPIGTARVRGTLSFPAGYVPDRSEASHLIVLRAEGSGAPLGRAVAQAGPSLDYLLADLPAGTYVLHAVARGMQPYTSAAFTVAAGQTVTQDIPFVVAAPNQPPVIDVPATDVSKAEAWEGDSFRNEVVAHDPDPYNTLRYTWWYRLAGGEWRQILDRPGDPVSRPIHTGTTSHRMVTHPATSLENVDKRVVVQDNAGATAERVFYLGTLHDVNRPPSQDGQGAALSGGANRNDPVVCTLDAAAADPDPEDTVSYTYTWQRDGATVVHTTEALADALPPAELAKRQTWSCTVTATDQMGLASLTPVSAEGSVTIGNLPPTVVNGAWTVERGQTLTVGAPGLLAGASDPDGDVLFAQPVTPATVPGATPYGTLLTLNPDGSFSYLASPSRVGTDSFSFRTSDGTATSGVGLAMITVTAPLDTVPPAVTGLFPAADTIAVPVRTNLQIVFDEAIFRGAGNVTIHGEGREVFESIPVDDVRIQIAAQTVTITPQAQFAGGTAYYVLIAPGCFTDAAGNPFAGIADPATWTFTTTEWADADGDGLEDAWELTWFGDRRYGAASDPDGDGVPNAQEYDAGSSPSGYVLHLEPGWNLVSIARPPQDRTVPSVFGDAVSPRAWRWNAARRAYELAPALDPLEGVWVFAPTAGDIPVAVPAD